MDGMDRLRRANSALNPLLPTLAGHINRRHRIRASGNRAPFVARTRRCGSQRARKGNVPRIHQPRDPHVDAHTIVSSLELLQQSQLTRKQAGRTDAAVAASQLACPANLTLLIDQVRTLQIVLNLLVDATKFTSEGPVWLHVDHLEGKPDTAGSLVIEALQHARA
ncbi:MULTISPECIES: hypothetical protein [unclassified Burkholderia]|uniref:hypothetical protein n=1 Tax=unclassified Burkholderia TaxID=2613784 RepID=UPI0024463B2B|nr:MULTISPECIES: hypothetical protein [unclassified Burkholderia]